jgi:hypothetical protein
VPALTPQQEQSKDFEESATDIHGDDSEVPMADVVSVHTQNPSSTDYDNDLTNLYIPGEEGDLISTTDAESTFVESVKSEVVDTIQGGQAIKRGKQTKRANMLYSLTSWVANDGSDEE